LSSVSLMKWRPALGEPQTQKLLTLLEDATVLMEDHAVIRVRDDTGLRVDPGDGLVMPCRAIKASKGEITPLTKLQAFFPGPASPAKASTRKTTCTWSTPISTRRTSA